MKLAWIGPRVLSRVQRHPSLVAGFAATFFLLTLLAGGGWMVARTGAGFAPALADEVNVIGYLRDDVGDDQSGALADRVRRLPGVRRVTVVNSDQALDRLRRDVGRMHPDGHEADRALAGIEEGFLPRSIEIAMDSSAAAAGRAGELAARLRGLPELAQVDDMGDGLGRLREVAATTRAFGWTVIALAALSGLVLLLVPIFVARARTDDEVVVLRLLGATTRQVKLPAALLGSLAAVLGMGLGLLALAGVRRAAVRSLQGAARLVWDQAAFLDPRLVAPSVLLVMVLGFVMGAVSIAPLRQQDA